MSDFFVDTREAGQELAITSVHTVNADGYIRLSEVPLKYINRITVNGSYDVREQSGGTPTTLRFVVNYTSGKVTFHTNEIGKSVSVSYLGRGSVIWAEDINLLYDLNEEVISARGDLASLSDRMSTVIDEEGNLIGTFIIDVNEDGSSVSVNPTAINFTHALDVGVNVNPSGVATISLDESEIIASGIPITPSGNLSATDIESALYELQGDIDNAATGNYLEVAENLADLNNAATARTNLGLGTIALLNTIDISAHTNLAAGDGVTLINDTISFNPSGISHYEIQNVGIYTHDDIDNHIDDLSAHWASGVGSLYPAVEDLDIVPSRSADNIAIALGSSTNGFNTLNLTYYGSYPTIRATNTQTPGNSGLYIYLDDAVSMTFAGDNIAIRSNFYPNQSNVWELGTTDYRWEKFWVGSAGIDSWGSLVISTASATSIDITSTGSTAQINIVSASTSQSQFSSSGSGNEYTLVVGGGAAGGLGATGKIMIQCNSLNAAVTLTTAGLHGRVLSLSTAGILTPRILLNADYTSSPTNLAGFTYSTTGNRKITYYVNNDAGSYHEFKLDTNAVINLFHTYLDFYTNNTLTIQLATTAILAKTNIDLGSVADEFKDGYFSGNVTAATPTLDGHLATKGYVDDIAISGSPSLINNLWELLDVDIDMPASGQILQYNGADWINVDNTIIDGLPNTDHNYTGHATNTFSSGYSASAMDLVFLGSGGKWLEVDSDTVTNCNGLLGIAMEAKNNTEPMLVVLPGSFVRDDNWDWTVGATLYAGGTDGTTVGGMQETIPTVGDGVVKVVGFAVTADVIFFNPSPDQHTTVA